MRWRCGPARCGVAAAAKAAETAPGLLLFVFGALGGVAGGRGLGWPRLTSVGLGWPWLASQEERSQEVAAVLT